VSVGFKKDQVRVQLTTSRLLKISGERPIGGNKWRRFHKEFRVPADCDTREITAKLEGGVLYIRLPKKISPGVAHDPLQDKAKPTTEPPKPQQPQPQAQPQLPPQPEAQPQAPLPEPQREPQPQPQPPSYIPKKDAVPKAEEEGVGARGEREEAPHKDAEKKEGGGLIKASKQVVAGGSRVFMNLRKPENMMKRVVLPAFVLLILGFYIFYMFKSLTMIEDQQESLLEFDREL